MKPLHQEEQSDDRSEAAIPFAEWVIAALGTLLVVATFGFLIARAFAEKEPPSFAADVEQIGAVGDNFAVTATVQNHGGRAAASLVVRGQAGGSKERELTIDYLPAYSGRRVTFLFDQPVDLGNFKCTFISYNDP